MPFQAPITIATALERMHRHDYVLPAIQREFVWGTDRICKLFDSLMRGYPFGSFLFWQVSAESVRSFTFYDFVRSYHARDAPHCPTLEVQQGAAVTAVLDGQQRLTALNIGLRGSHAEKLPYKRISNAAAYPITHLHLDLLREGEDDDLEMEYAFRFLTSQEAATRSQGADEHWYRVSQVREMNSGAEVFSYVARHDLPPRAGGVLFRLFTSVHTDLVINYYEEESQHLEKVLNIFIRVNSGAVPLSYSDLLLSVATAQWRERDAREEIHALVDELNKIGQGFQFSKNLVLKAGLVLLGKTDIRFKVDNFDRNTMLDMEKRWPEIEASLVLAAELLRDLGFSGNTLPADSVLIPLAHYVHLRGLSNAYLRRAADAADRAEIRTWLMRAVLKSGIWGSGLDTLLAGIRRVIDDEGLTGFPRESIEREMARQGKGLRFEPAELDDLADVKYGRRAFPVLALLYPGVDVRLQTHIDHVVPRSLFTAARLRAKGVAADDVPAYLERVDRLANLQLLEGVENIDKRAQWPTDWLLSAYPDPAAQAGYRARNDLGDLPVDLLDFPRFYEQRRAVMRDRLAGLLGVSGGEAAAEPDVDARYEEAGDVGSSGRIAAHVVAVLQDEPAGTVLTVAQLSDRASSVYPEGTPRPSRGAISGAVQRGITGVTEVASASGARAARLT